MATVPINPRGFLNDLTGKQSIAKLKWATRHKLEAGRLGSVLRPGPETREGSCSRIHSLPPPRSSVSSLTREEASQRRREAALQEYSELKAELTKLTGTITALGSAYCFLSFSLETALSFAFGCVFSVAYLQELHKAADSLSRERVPKVFQGRLPRQKSGSASLVSAAKVAGSLERFLEGSKLALSSPRLILPGLMILAWAASSQAAAGDAGATHLELAPLILGFFTYKAAVLVVAFRDARDLL